jgi:hypothetical protein
LAATFETAATFLRLKMSAGFHFESWYETVCENDAFEDELTADEVKEYLSKGGITTRAALLHLHVHDFPAEWKKETTVTLLNAIIALERAVAMEEAETRGAAATLVSVASGAAMGADTEDEDDDDDDDDLPS